MYAVACSDNGGPPAPGMYWFRSLDCSLSHGQPCVATNIRALWVTWTWAVRLPANKVAFIHGTSMCCSGVSWVFSMCALPVRRTSLSPLSKACFFLGPEFPGSEPPRATQCYLNCILRTGSLREAMSYCMTPASGRALVSANCLFFLGCCHLIVLPVQHKA